MRTMNSYSAVQLRWLKAWGALALGVVLLAGCASRQEKAFDQAKKQAAATGQAQQVISVATDGTTTTTIVQPPAPGQSGQAVTTTVAPGPANAPGKPPPPAGLYYQPSGTAQGEGQPIPGGAPVVRPADVNIPAGSQLAIRINQNISVKHTESGTRFDGEVEDGWTDANGRVILHLKRG